MQQLAVAELPVPELTSEPLPWLFWLVQNPENPAGIELLHSALMAARDMGEGKQVGREAGVTSRRSSLYEHRHNMQGQCGVCFSH